MAKNKWMSALQKFDGAILKQENPHFDVVRTPSPSVNFSFGNGHGVPKGYSLLLFGPPGGGKSILANSMIGQLHKEDPEAIAIRFDTELRTAVQLTDEMKLTYGIDKDRLQTIETNDPVAIFDRIEKEIPALIQEGAPIKMIVIDSLSMIRGRRSLGEESVDKQIIGDHALTLKTGFERILVAQRRNKLPLILTNHVAAEFDQAEIMRGNKVKMATGFGTQHFAEYFMYVEMDKTKKGRTTLLDKPMENETLTDIHGNSDNMGHRIRTVMKKSSLGPAGRWGEFVFDYKKGIINQHEEIFLLGLSRNLIKREGSTYTYDKYKYVGKDKFAAALQADTTMQKSILDELKRRDLEKEWDGAPEATEKPLSAANEED